MATVQNNFGLIGANYLTGGAPVGTSFSFPIESGYPGSFGSGEPVSLTGGFLVNTVAATAYPPAAPAEIMVGVFQNVSYQPSPLSTPPQTFSSWVANTQTFNAQNAMAMVNVDPMQIYNVQANGPVEQASIGLNFNLAGFNNINPFLQTSGVYMSTTALAGNNQWGQVKLVGLAPVQTWMTGGNNWGDAYTIVQVVLNSTFVQSGQYALGA